MRKAKVYVKGIEAGILTESKQGKEYVFEYLDGYERLEVSRTMPTKEKVYRFDRFPPFSVSPVPRCFKKKTNTLWRKDFFQYLWRGLLPRSLRSLGEARVGVSSKEDNPSKQHFFKIPQLYIRKRIFPTGLVFFQFYQLSASRYTGFWVHRLTAIPASE